MKKQARKTISTLSLFVVLSVNAANVSAFPTACGGRCNTMQYSSPLTEKRPNIQLHPTACTDRDLNNFTTGAFWRLYFQLDVLGPFFVSLL